MLTKLKQAFEHIWSWTSTISGVLLLVNIGLIIVNIILRRFFGAPIFGSTELVRYFSLTSASFALAQNEWYEGNVTMTLLLEKVSAKAGNMLRVIIDAVCFCGFIYVDNGLWKQFVKRLGDGSVSQDLSIPIWIISLILTVGFLFLTICFFCKCCLQIGVLRNDPAGMPQRPLEPGMEDIEKMDILLQRQEMEG